MMIGCKKGLTFSSHGVARCFLRLIVGTRLSTFTTKLLKLRTLIIMIVVCLLSILRRGAACADSLSVLNHSRVFFHMSRSFRALAIVPTVLSSSHTIPPMILRCGQVTVSSYRAMLSAGASEGS